jgi:L-threonylcarbamoyladenylate synthase
MAETGIDVRKAKNFLLEGQLVAIPTETVYGLAANALDVTSVAKIFEAKGRPKFDPLIVHVANLDLVTRYASNVDDQAKSLARAFWPGPLTLLLEKREVIPGLVTAGLETVGLRCPDHPLALELLASLPFPLAAPSANPFGYVSPTRPSHVEEQLGNKISYILDGGPCRVGVESTIVGFPNGRATVFRQGGVTVEQIESVVGSVDVKTHSTSNPQAPGQLQSHYAPKQQVLLGDINKMMKEHEGRTFAVLSFQKQYALPFAYVLSTRGDLNEAAANLFEGLRQLEKMPVDIILAEAVPDVGLGKAINDRLTRAAG